ncbi:hypothetical protein GLAREA_08434 [Glarea lozoyensis ATCC 20868]|uniref:DUF7918 domain-containing protein n=1 Tax=Glarea lozoyensis (strain ATCC 20868 / MF5171) TaxID=1116229 RepID=S3CDH7_GLAL2|nr:uncharacterized protein GLAREA_08434 [Glarea lozoyensis ATCC 20868]EPE24582.1 hypothetical protein GLAREA_08434 [Glarea lozoyensis ATCC 20868]
MAILPAHPKLSVTITSNNRTLPEYPDPSPFVHKTFWGPPESVSSVYVECESDTEFQINYEVKPGFELERRHNEVSFWADVNGQSIGGSWSGGVRYGWKKCFSEAITRPNEVDMAYQTLKFSSLEKLDNVSVDRLNNDRKSLDGLGEILVCVYRSYQTTIIDERFVQRPLESVTEMSEKALKGQAISHGVVFGGEVREPPERPHYKRTYPDGYYTPLAIFRFKYRSREALQQELIIPRSPSRSVTPAAETNQERLTRLKREISHIKAEEKSHVRNRAVKREIPDDDELQILESRPRKRNSVLGSGVVIDLTDD